MVLPEKTRQILIANYIGAEQYRLEKNWEVKRQMLQDALKNLQADCAARHGGFKEWRNFHSKKFYKEHRIECLKQQKKYKERQRFIRRLKKLSEYLERTKEERFFENPFSPKDKERVSVYTLSIQRRIGKVTGVCLDN